MIFHKLKRIGNNCISPVRTQMVVKELYPCIAELG